MSIIAKGMVQTTTSFPTLAFSASAFLSLCGLWMIFRRSRRRVGAEPRCHHCDYILIGITSERCPECGTVIDSHGVARGRRRGRAIRVILGLVLLIASPVISWGPVGMWWRSIYWYQYRSTSSVMHDLMHGNGQPTPANNPLEQGVRRGHGWLGEDVDLARVALDELLRRDKLGKLSSEYRRQIDEMALANMFAPITTPGQYYLNDELCDRLIAGKLSAEDQAKIYQGAVAITLSSQPIVMQWDAVPIQIRFQTRLLSSSKNNWVADVTFKSVRIDGKEINWSDDGETGRFHNMSLSGQSDTNIDRLIAYTTLGHGS